MWCAGINALHVLCFAVLELNEERDTAGETQQNGDFNPDDQTQMTSFEINLKDKRFVCSYNKNPNRFQKKQSLQNQEHLIYIESACTNLNFP